MNSQNALLSPFHVPLQEQICMAAGKRSDSHVILPEYDLFAKKKNKRLVGVGRERERD